MDWKKLINQFILNEGVSQKPSLFSFCESLSRLLDSLKPSSTKDSRLLEIAKQHLKEVRSGIRRLHEEKQQLEEQLKILEEEKVKKSKKKKK
jgi:hypothetical protein